MMRMNRAMLTRLGEVMAVDFKLNTKLGKIAKKGFYLFDGCYVLRALMKNTNVDVASFPDRTGYECFNNSLHIDDYDMENPLEQSILFVKNIFNVWGIEVRPMPLVAIISIDESSVVVKFHAKRSAETWLADDIEKYDDPIMEVSSECGGALASLGIS